VSIVKEEEVYQQETRLNMPNLPKSRNHKEIHRMIKLLSETYKNPVFFRKEKVETLKRLIKSNNYCVPGKNVVDKWFPKMPVL